jgi:hypothetical protein
MQQSFHNMAQRAVNARENLIDTIAELGNVRRSIAATVADYYVGAKFARLDIGIGRYNVRDGAFFDPVVIRRAAAIAPGWQTFSWPGSLMRGASWV